MNCTGKDIYTICLGVMYDLEYIKSYSYHVYMLRFLGLRFTELCVENFFGKLPKSTAKLVFIYLGWAAISEAIKGSCFS